MWLTLSKEAPEAQYKRQTTKDSPWSVLRQPWRFSTGQGAGCETQRMLFHADGSGLVTHSKRNVISLTVWMCYEQGKEVNHLKTLAGIALVFCASFLCTGPSFLCLDRGGSNPFSPPSEIWNSYNYSHSLTSN
jgi:hypothetical protein